MIYKPHNYQKYATEFIESHKESAILLDMGLGKTSITLTAINNLLFDSFDVHKVLVIAPLRVARFSWKAEIEKWEHLQNLKYEIVVVTAKNIKDGKICYELSKEYVREADYEEIMHRGIPQIGDILFTTEAPLGQVANVDRTDIA